MVNRKIHTASDKLKKKFYINLYKLNFNYDEFFRFPFLNKNEIRTIQLEKLKKILKVAVETVPYYKRLNIKIDFDNFSINELKKFPIVDRQTIQQHFDEFISTKYKNRGFLSHTSGSTGTPFEFMIPYESDFIEEMTAYRAWMMGKDYVYKPKDPIIVLRSYTPDENEPLYKINRKKNYWYLSPFHINEKNLDLYLDIIHKSRAKLIRGYPSSIYIFTLLLKEKGIKLPQIKSIVTSSETLLPLYRETIESYWGIKVLDWYGQNERTVTVQQCWAGNYHNNDDYGIIELNEDNEIIATSLNNYVMPFVRYNTKDRAIPLDQNINKCPCGRNLSIPFKGIEGRSDDILVKDDGTKIPTANFSTAMKNFTKLKQFQIIQYPDKSIILKLVLQDRSSDYIEKIKQEVIKRLGKVNIKVVLVDNIERDKTTGKLKVTIRKDGE